MCVCATFHPFAAFERARFSQRDYIGAEVRLISCISIKDEDLGCALAAPRGPSQAHLRLCPKQFELLRNSSSRAHCSTIDMTVTVLGARREPRPTTVVRCVPARWTSGQRVEKCPRGRPRVVSGTS